MVNALNCAPIALTTDYWAHLKGTIFCRCARYIRYAMRVTGVTGVIGFLSFPFLAWHCSVNSFSALMPLYRFSRSYIPVKLFSNPFKSSRQLYVAINSLNLTPVYLAFKYNISLSWQQLELIGHLATRGSNYQSPSRDDHVVLIIISSSNSTDIAATATTTITTTMSAPSRHFLIMLLPP